MIQSVIIESPKFNIPRCPFFAPSIIVIMLIVKITKLIRTTAKLEKRPMMNIIINMRKWGIELEVHEAICSFGVYRDSKVLRAIFLWLPRTPLLLANFQKHIVQELYPSKTLRN